MSDSVDVESLALGVSFSVVFGSVASVCVESEASFALSPASVEVLTDNIAVLPERSGASVTSVLDTFALKGVDAAVAAG